jgi:hypothetical protein
MAIKDYYVKYRMEHRMYLLNVGFDDVIYECEKLKK